MPNLAKDDRLVEYYEAAPLLSRIQDVLESEGVLTVADYQKALGEIRHEAHSPSPLDV